MRLGLLSQRAARRVEEIVAVRLLARCPSRPLSAVDNRTITSHALLRSRDVVVMFALARACRTLPAMEEIAVFAVMVRAIRVRIDETGVHIKVVDVAAAVRNLRRNHCQL